MRYDSIFLIFICVLTTGILAVSGAAEHLFDDSIFVKREQQKLEEKISQADLREKLLHEQLFDYQQSVAQELGPDKVDTWAKMNLLTASRQPSSVAPFDTSELLLTRAKELFNKKDYAGAARAFQDVISKYPASPHSVESRFLKAEALFLSGDTESCVDEVEFMMTQYPEHPMTGYSMLRLSQILQSKNRKPEAVEILRMVEKNFVREADLRDQASSLERKLLAL